jgi:hypothetical protein
VAATVDLLEFDLLEGTLWLDARKRQAAQRAFRPAATAARAAFRHTMPLTGGSADTRSTPVSAVIGEYLRATPASEFYPLDEAKIPR